MLANPTGKLQRLVSELLINEKYEKALEMGHRDFNIRQFRLKLIKPNNILQMYYQISSRFYGQNVKEFKNFWHQNQLKIFIWLLIGYSYLQKRNVLYMNQDDWLFFSQIFRNHSPQALQYQSLLIVKVKNKPQKWGDEQINLLNSIIKNGQRKNMWKQTALTLYCSSEKKYFRTAKQCRQFWINHLDPIPLKTSWSIKEDIQLIEWAYLLKKKWSKISKLFEGRRTQHMVKNRFNSLYNSQIKKYSSGQNFKQYQVMMSLKQRLKNQIALQQKREIVKTITDIPSKLDDNFLHIEDIYNQNQSCISFYNDYLVNRQNQEQYFQQEIIQNSDSVEMYNYISSHKIQNQFPEQKQEGDLAIQKLAKDSFQNCMNNERFYNLLEQ